MRAPTPHLFISAFVGVVFLSSACSQWQVTDPSSPYFMPLPGSQVIVHQRLEIPPGTTRVFFQHGKLLSLNKIFQYDINCELEIGKLADTVRYIEPGTYTVTRTRRQTEDIIRNDWQEQPIQFASLTMAGVGINASMDGSPGSTMRFEIIRMRLEGEAGTLLRELSCRGALADPSKMEMPTVAEMREALGEYVSIKTPQENPM